MAARKHRVATPTETSKKDSVAARVNWGRWVANCNWCPSAQIVSPADPQFFCPECANGGLGKWVPIRFPTEADQTKISEILSVRPVENRNWEPHESTKDLRGENKEHEVG